MKSRAVATKPKFDIASLRPADTPDYMMPAWLGCLHWALGEQEIIDAFRQETGQTWVPGRTPLDRMIDDATGAPTEFFKAFVLWMNENLWGPVE